MTRTATIASAPDRGPEESKDPDPDEQPESLNWQELHSVTDPV
jgi:hypothetical protein